MSSEKEKQIQDPTKPPVNPQVQRILDEIASLKRSSLEIDAKIEKLAAEPRGETDVKPSPDPNSTMETAAVILKHIEECPDCFSEVYKKAYQDKVVECEGCGKHVRKTDPKCPSCGGTKARI